MTRAGVTAAIADAERFIVRARALLASRVSRYDSTTPLWDGDGAPILQGAVKRASMDLTRVLAAMRGRS